MDETSDDALWLEASDSDPCTRARALQVLAGRFFEKQDFEQSAAAADTAAELFARLGQVSDAASCWFTVGSALGSLRRPEEALVAYESASSAFRESGDESDLAVCEFRLGLCLAELGREEEAEGRYLNAGTLYDSDGRHGSAAEARMHAGELQGSAGRFQDALDTFREARRNWRRVGHADMAARAADREAASLIELDEVAQAVEVLQTALHIREVGSDGEALAYARYRLGWTLTIAGRAREALPLLDEAAGAYREADDAVGVARCDLKAADALADLDQLDDACRLYRRCISVLDSVGDDGQALIARINLALAVERRGDRQEAVRLHRDALQRAHAIEDRNSAVGGTVRLARLLLEAGEVEEAVGLVTDLGCDVDSLGAGERIGLLLVRAQALTAVHDGVGAAAVLTELLPLLRQPDRGEERAQAEELLAELAELRGDLPTAYARRTLAVALHLEADRPDRATSASKWFLLEGRVEQLEAGWSASWPPAVDSGASMPA